MGRILRRLKLGKKNKLVFEAALAVLFIIVFIGILGGIATTYKTKILTTEDLWKHANTTLITFEFRNATDPAASRMIETYTLTDVATYYNGYLYISVPYPAGYEVLRGISIYNLTTSDGQVLTARYLVEHGVNKLVLYIEPINSTTVTFKPTYSITCLQLLVERDGNGIVWSGSDIALLDVVKDVASKTADDITKWKALFPDNGTVNRDIDIDLGSIAIKTAGYTNNIVGFARFVGDVKNLEGLKLKLEMYAVSEKPVLKALTEPVYSVVAGLYAAFLAAVNRIRQYVMSAAAGFTTSFAFTGLIGDPVVALVVTIIIVTVVFILIKKK